jgi:hypothetical protein
MFRFTKMTGTPFPLLSLAVVLTMHTVAAPSSAAQNLQLPQRPPDGGTREVLVSILIPSLRNAPFTATVNTQWIRQLADGTTITLVNHRTIARDRAGRIFQERRLLVPDDGKHESVVTQTEISDPVAHNLYICVPAQRVCQLEFFSAPPFVPPPAGGQPGAAGQENSPAVENLGKQSFAGLETVGTRQTQVIEIGAIGNNAPMTITREFWYSPQLGVNIVSKLQDPRFGIQDFELSDLNVGDPDPKLFQVPEGSTVLNLKRSVPAPR